MKSKYMQRLHDDFSKCAKKIGILDNEMPKLVTNRKTMDEIRSKWSDGGHGISTSNNYGICYIKQQVIYVNKNPAKYSILLTERFHPRF